MGYISSSGKADRQTVPNPSHFQNPTKRNKKRRHELGVLASTISHLFHRSTSFVRAMLAHPLHRPHIPAPSSRPPSPPPHSALIFLTAVLRALATVSAAFTALLANKAAAQDRETRAQAAAVLALALLRRWTLLVSHL